MNIIVLNLPRDIDESVLHGLFSAYGVVDSAKVVMDEAAQRSKGFAFVEMADETEAGEAIAALHGSQVGNQKIRVKIAEPRAE